MLGLILGIVIPLVYFTVGWKLAVMDMPRQWEIHSRYSEDFARSEILLMSALTFFLWPVRGPMVLLCKSMDRANPERVKIQERKIRELERELGINEGSDAYGDSYGRFRGEDSPHYRRPYGSRGSGVQAPW